MILKAKLSQVCGSFKCIITNLEFKKKNPNNKTNQPQNPTLSPY